MTVLHPDQFKAVYETEHGSARVSPGGYISNVHVKPGDRGQGHGTKLMQTIISDADRLKQPLSLHAREDLHPWYHGMGFEVVGQDPIGHQLRRESN